MGLCFEEDMLDDSTGDDSHSEDQDHEIEEDEHEVDPEIPFWCEPFIDIDSDCDGYIDETGEELL
ncbi:MAG: hypothetical protein R2827_00350 [Bdellovibrionales bacterium]